MIRFYFRFIFNFSYSLLHKVGGFINQMPDKEVLHHLFQTPLQRTPFWKKKKRLEIANKKNKVSTKQKGNPHSEQKTFNHHH